MIHTRMLPFVRMLQGCNYLQEFQPAEGLNQYRLRTNSFRAWG